MPAAFVDIAHVEDGLASQELSARERLRLLRVLRLRQASRLRGAQQVERLGEHGGLDFRLLVALLRLLHEVRHAALEGFEVGEHQLGLDGLGVRDGIDAALHVRDVAALEATQDMDDGVDLADVGEELVAEAFALACPAHQTGDVDELDLSLDLLCRLRDLGDLVEARVGDRDAADVGLDRAEGIVRRLRGSSFGQGIEKRRFADVRQADDAAAEAHE